ncbi:MAG: SAM-dependent methyltransferase [Dehalococcoidia bacterium]
MATPNLVLAGYGVTDSLQLTVELQRMLARVGTAYSIGLPPNLAAFLKAQHVKVTDLASHLAPGRAYAEGYLDIANFLIERTGQERPVIFLAPGNPLVFNAVGRYLAMEGRRLGLAVQVMPAVSQLDLIIAAIGLDVSTFGLQVFDAARLVSRRIQVNPLVPALLMNLGGIGADLVPGPSSAPPDLAGLLAHLAPHYPGEHPAVVVQLSSSGASIASVPLANLGSVSSQIQESAHLFLDLVRPGAGAPRAAE